MKIIISESQYNLLLESNTEKNKRLVGKMWDEGMNMDEISSLIGLDKSQIISLLKDKEIKKIETKIDIMLLLSYSCKKPAYLEWWRERPCETLATC